MNRNWTATGPEDRERKFDGRTVMLGVVCGGLVERLKGATYPAMRELVARNILAVGSEKGGETGGSEYGEMSTKSRKGQGRQSRHVNIT
jgi:hypothetical protein